MKVIGALILGLIFIYIFVPGASFNKKYNTSPTPTPVTYEFHGSPCTSDCSGHEAGYNWAQDHDITDPDDCGGNSDSFIEGCRSYAEENNTYEEEPPEQGYGY